MASLTEYRKKRKFTETSEPRGKDRLRDGNQFVVQEHHARRLHYDFRLEIDGVLKSWAVPKGPSMNPADKRLAVQTEDHPLEYGSFHGTIPAGNYGAGEVKIWDHGTFEPDGELSASEQLRRGELKFILYGDKLKGSFVLVKLRRSESGRDWLLIKHRDDAAISGRLSGPKSPARRGIAPDKKSADPASSTAHQPSLRKKHKMPKGAREAPMPQNIRVALATLADAPFSDPEWLFEIKWDGGRTLSAIRDGKVRLWSRSDRDVTREYPELSELPAHVDADTAWLDGEVVALDEEGRSDFQKLQLRFSVQRPSAQLLEQVPIVYYVFDLLYLDGYDLRPVPLIERKNLLKKVLRPDSRILYSDHILEKGKELFEVAIEKRLEGIVAKKIASPYPVGRTSSWLKIKLDQDIDAVVGGWTDPRGAREYFGALLLGLYDGDELEYIGSVGSGFSTEVQQKFWPQLQNLRVNEPPFSAEPATREQAYWVKPELVARVRFGGWTEGRHLRQPHFLGLQGDRDAKDCTFEEQMKRPITKKGARIADEPRPKKKSSAALAHPRPAYSEDALNTEKSIQDELENGKSDNIFIELDDHRLHLTNLNKIYFPEDGFKKRDLLAHYFWASPMILPFLKDRPLVLRRYPNGIDGESFFQKDAGKDAPEWVKTAAILSEDRGRTARYILGNDRATLIYLSNLGCIDQNPWSSRYDDQEHPDYIFFDLDPSEGTPFVTVVKYAKLFLEALAELKIRAFAKTSGATGFHIFIPIEPHYTFEQARLFVQAVSSIVSKRSPGVLTSERTVRKRASGSIYVDAHQNSRGQSLACAYSVRAFPHAPVSAPVRLGELRADLRPEKWNLKTMRRRVDSVGDLWADFWNSRQTLESLFKRVDRT